MGWWNLSQLRNWVGKNLLLIVPSDGAKAPKNPLFNKSKKQNPISNTCDMKWCGRSGWKKVTEWWWWKMPKLQKFSAQVAEEKNQRAGIWLMIFHWASGEYILVDGSWFFKWVMDDFGKKRKAWLMASDSKTVGTNSKRIPTDVFYTLISHGHGTNSFSLRFHDGGD